MIRLRNVFHHFVSNLIGAGSPDINDLIVFFTLGDKTVLILLFKLFNLSLGFFNQSLFCIGNDQIVFTERDTGLTCVLEAQSHDAVDKHNGFFLAAVAVNGIDDFTDFLFTQQTVNQRERNILMFRQRLGNNDTSRRCLNQAFLKLAVVVHIFETAFNLGVQVHNFLIQSQLNFVKVREDHSFAGHAFSIIGQVVDTQNHILGRNDNRFTRSRRQNVVG